MSSNKAWVVPNWVFRRIDEDHDNGGVLMVVIQLKVALYILLSHSLNRGIILCLFMGLWGL